MVSRNPYKKGGMFEGANHLLFERAKELRKNMTHAESILWMHIKSGINGFKFRRQHSIGLFIADFYCHKAKLIIEIDGSIHTLTDVIDLDKVRQLELEKWGYCVIRFTNQQVKYEIEKVISSINKTLTELINKQNAS